MSKKVRQAAIKLAAKLGISVAAATTMIHEALAAGPDFTGLTGQIDWTTAIAAVLLVMGGLAGVYVVMTGGSLIIQKLRAGK